MNKPLQPVLSVIIVSWNTKEITGNCLESLFLQPTTVPFEVYVVDNGSSDGSTDMIEKSFPRVKLIKNAFNAGFAVANNQVLSSVSTPYALLLNSDTVIPQRDVFGPWIDFMETNQDVALSGCRLHFPDGSHQVGDGGYRPSFLTVFSHAFFLSRLFPQKAKGLFITSLPADAIDVDWVSGAAAMVRVSALRKVGLLDESIFMFAEDIEWGCRFKEKGWRVCYLPFISIVHLQGASSKKQVKPSEFSLLWIRNVRKIYAHYNPRYGAWTFDLLMALGFLLRSQFYGWRGLIKGSSEDVNRAKKMVHYLEGLIS